MPTPPARPWTNRAAMSVSMVGLSAHSAEVAMYALTPTSSGRRRPNRSDSGPATSCPRASPSRHAVMVSWAVEVGRPKLEGERGQHWQVQVHGDRTEDRQQSQHDRQCPPDGLFARPHRVVSRRGRRRVGVRERGGHAVSLSS
jgi:hypothetical protein